MEAMMGGPDGAATGSLLLLLLFLLGALLLLAGTRRRASRGAAGSKSPPGPFAWPLVGNVLQLGRLPHLAFARLARRYGAIFQLRLGSRRVVVLNGEAAIRRALVGLGSHFAGRPNFPSFGLVSGGRSVAFGACSPQWRARRRLAHAALRARSTAAEVERHVAAEAGDLVRLFLRRSHDGAYFQPCPLLVVANANVLCALCFGRRYGHADEEFAALLGRNDRFGQTVGAGSLVDVLPWLLWFPNPVRRVYRDFQALTQELHDFVQAKVAQHRQTFDPRAMRDVSDVMIATVERGSVSPHGLGPEDVESAMTDIFGAGQDTTSTALSWVLLLLLKHPQLQQDLQAELDRVVGRGRLPTAEDRPHLPLLEAFIYETLRYSSFVPITIPHATTADVELEGYHIPKDTVVFVNQWSVNHDSSKWPEPQRFDPTRFLDEQQCLDRDRASSVMIFSTGQRRCIGDQLSKLQLFLFTAILLHQCSFHANPAEKLTMDCIHGLALRPLPFTVTARPRLPVLIQP
uniref:Cytochrome P450 family 1 subfamily B member 1 n=1 Tax=Anas platyrhynchos platyrhynchos TaxID=8840 RepID=A0A493SVS6_ANAPP|eukprot:XP_005029435.2 cytochrome P450 1B1 [Anas platyrhynchos]